jgi:hypothetical protein
MVINILRTLMLNYQELTIMKISRIIGRIFSSPLAQTCPNIGLKAGLISWEPYHGDRRCEVEIFTANKLSETKKLLYFELSPP